MNTGPGYHSLQSFGFDKKNNNISRYVSRDFSRNIIENQTRNGCKKPIRLYLRLGKAIIEMLGYYLNQILILTYGPSYSLNFMTLSFQIT